MSKRAQAALDGSDLEWGRAEPSNGLEANGRQGKRERENEQPGTTPVNAKAEMSTHQSTDREDTAAAL
jgi:hypothetical protein